MDKTIISRFYRVHEESMEVPEEIPYFYSKEKEAEFTYSHKNEKLLTSIPIPTTFFYHF